jgi:tyrosinase
MHISANDSEIHGRSCFLPWHRSFLVDIERKLQVINPAVTLPYWDFAEKAPKLFSNDFMGLPDSTGMVSFSNTNPLINWKSQLFGAGDGTRIRRIFQSTPRAGSIPWDPATEHAVAVQNNENQTIGLGNVFTRFARMEGDPHGGAHVSFLGQINSPGTAPADPLFFLLHCNIDRLWAKWQWLKGLFQQTNVDAYPRQGNGNSSVGGEFGIGNFTKDTMWPWNGIHTSPRPPHAPGTGLPQSPLTTFPGKRPILADMIDYHGQNALSNNLHFAYNDVSFDF